jgi:AcrR family transcriptional regulator
MITTTRRRPTEARRQELIDDARRILATHGMDGLTTKALAKAASITEGAIYRHFRSKNELLLRLIDDIEETLLEIAERAKESSGSPLETLEKLLREHLSAAERRSGVTFVVIAEVLRGDLALRRRMQAVIERYLTMVDGLLEEAVRVGQVSPTIDRWAAALAFFGLVQATITLWRFADEELPVAGRHQALWRVFSRGIAV